MNYSHSTSQRMLISLSPWLTVTLSSNLPQIRDGSGNRGFAFSALIECSDLDWFPGIHVLFGVLTYMDRIMHSQPVCWRLG